MGSFGDTSGSCVRNDKGCYVLLESTRNPAPTLCSEVREQYCALNTPPTVISAATPTVLSSTNGLTTTQPTSKLSSWHVKANKTIVLFSPDCHPTVTLLSDKHHLIAPSVQSPAPGGVLTLEMVYVIRFGHTYQLMMPYCSCFSVPDGCFQLILPPTVEFDSAAAALSIFHTKVLERKLLVIPAQLATPPFSPDSTAARQPTCPTSIVPPLPLAHCGTKRHEPPYWARPTAVHSCSPRIR